MGKCQSRKKSESQLSREETIELEKVLQLCLNEKEECQAKYESTNRKYQQAKIELIKALKTVKDLQRQLVRSEANVTSLYLRYAIETDLNQRLRQSQIKLKEEKERLEKSARNSTTVSTNSEVLERLQQFEQRIYLLECRWKDVL